MPKKEKNIFFLFPGGCQRSTMKRLISASTLRGFHSSGVMKNWARRMSASPVTPDFNTSVNVAEHRCMKLKSTSMACVEEASSGMRLYRRNQRLIRTGKHLPQQVLPSQDTDGRRRSATILLTYAIICIGQHLNA